MIGQEYFDLRSRLDSALLALRGIVAESSHGDDQTVAIDNLIKKLKDPFLFIVVGEESVDKSTFLNALAGADLSKAGVKSTPDKILLLQHGLKQKRVPVTPILDVVYVPADFFRDCNIVDTPGANSIENEHQEISTRFLPTADLVIFVFSAMNPWGASTLPFLEKIHQQLPGNVILVLQHSDQREPEEIQSILAYMKRLCVQRFSREFPIFPVSANRAYLARSTGIDSDQLLAESGFNSLEQHISGVINGSSTHLGKLADSLKTARKMLGSLHASFEKLNDQRLKRTGILRAIDSSLAAQAQRTFDKITPFSETVATGLQQSVQNTLAAAAAQLKSRAVLQNLFRKNWPYAEIEAPFRDETAAAYQERWNDATTILENDVSAMAEQVRSQLADGLNVQPDGKLEPDAIFWAAQRGRFLAQASGIQQRAVSGLKISQQLAPALASARKLFLRQMMFTAIGVIGVLALGATGSWIAAGCVAGAAVLAFLILDRTNAKLLARAYADCESQISGAPMKMKNLLDLHVRDETEELYEPFNKVLQLVREKLDNQDRKRTMLHQQIDNLGRIFEGLEAELGPSANPLT